MRGLTLRFSYYILLIVVAIDIVWLITAGISITFEILSAPVIFLCLALVYLGLVRYCLPQHRKTTRLYRSLVTAIQGLSFIGIAWVATAVLNHLTMTTRFAYADRTLAQWDAILGFDWLAYLQLVMQNPTAAGLLAHCYDFFMPVSLIAFMLLTFGNCIWRAWFLIEAFFVTCVVCIAFGTFFPAEGATIHHLRGAISDDMLMRFPGLYHLEALYRLRADPVPALDLLDLPGLVTFPSFHTAGGIVVAASLWRTAWFWPAAIYAAAMIASTPVYGAHYVIDLIAGMAVATGVLSALAASSQYRGVLRDQPTDSRAAKPAHGAVAKQA